jgi:hypothetical protein
MSYSNTLDRYKALARSKQEEPRFSPSWLKDYEIERYLAKRGTAKTPIITFDMFQVVILKKQVQEVVHAIGVCKGQKDTLLILKKK